MLIVETHDLIGGYAQPVYRVHAHLKAKGKRNRYVCFRAGVVVRQQLEAQRFFPVWARLSLVQGKKHKYYSLNLAGTFEIAKRKRWRIFFDPEIENWNLETASEP